MRKLIRGKYTCINVHFGTLVKAVKKYDNWGKIECSIFFRFKVIINFKNKISFKHIKKYYKYLLSYFYDFNKYYKYSILNLNSKNVLLSHIIRTYHVLEKGLTMPETRPGFGSQKLKELYKDCIIYSELYDKSNVQLLHAVSVILEYEKYHSDINYKLPYDILDLIRDIKKRFKHSSPSKQIVYSYQNYFQYTDSSFDKFSNSRKSIRNFSKSEISVESIKEALKIASNAPSACNRQSSRTYIYTNVGRIKKILELQGGSRGFGHLANKLIIVTSDISFFNGASERYQAYIDGGIYAMNLLYSLHFKRIGACIMNCSHSPQKDKAIRKITDIKDSEVFIAMIACGQPSNNLKITLSKRFPISYTNNIIN